ncbi:MAG: hypothetical protein SWO11_03255 [Thermodesulfobacteriota bacterium]|nr:hypothetical protein [Thermodesulfobacteriota bacterium]
MKKKIFYCTIAVFLAGLTLFACSNNKEAESEKAPIETMTDKAAKEWAHKIRTPIEKAHDVEKKQLERYKDIEETLKKE